MSKSGFHESLERDHELTGSSDRGFGIVFAVVFAVVALWPLLSSRPVRLWAAAASVLFLVAAVVRPSILHRMNILWMRSGILLSRVTNPVITALMFFVIFVPFGLLLRALGRKAIEKHLDRDLPTYWQKPERTGWNPASMRDQF
jgi:hypothetical protein